MDAFFHIGRDFLPHVSNHATNPPPQVLDERAHPVLGTKATYHSGDVYSRLTGQVATRSQLLNDPFFVPGTWHAPPKIVLDFLLARAHNIALSYSCDAGMVNINEPGLSIYQNLVVTQTQEDEDDSELAPEDIPDIIYKDAGGQTYPADSGSWDWRERAKLGFPWNHQDDAVISDPPDGPLQWRGGGGSVTVSKPFPEPPDPEPFPEGFAVTHQKNWPNVFPPEPADEDNDNDQWFIDAPDFLTVTRYPMHRYWPEMKRCLCQMSVDRAFIYNEKYHLWQLPVSVTLQGIKRTDYVEWPEAPGPSSLVPYTDDPDPSLTWPPSYFHLPEEQYQAWQDWFSDELYPAVAEQNENNSTSYRGGLGGEAWSLSPVPTPDPEVEIVPIAASVTPVDLVPSFSD